MQLGKPLLDIEISIDATEFLWSHGVISDEMLAIKRTVFNDSRYMPEHTHKNLSRECQDTDAKLEMERGSGTDSGDLLSPYFSSPTTQSVFMGDLAHAKLRIGEKKTEAGDPCLADRIYAYPSNPGVQKALHVKTNQLQAAWTFCSEFNLSLSVISRHTQTQESSGDQDSKIPLTQTRKIANLLAKELELTAFGGYGPWYDGLQVGGRSQSFGRITRNRNTTYLTFATVKGAAHELPFTSPSQALTLFKALLLRRIPPPKIRNN